MNQKYLKEELKKYGFFYLEGQIPERQARQFLTVKKTNSTRKSGFYS